MTDTDALAPQTDAGRLLPPAPPQAETAAPQHRRDRTQQQKHLIQITPLKSSSMMDQGLFFPTLGRLRSISAGRQGAVFLAAFSTHSIPRLELGPLGITERSKRCLLCANKCFSGG